jgi:hypothetical protein
MSITSQPKFLEDAFSAITCKMLKTFIKKNKDYGKGNILDTGELGIIFRINDKIRRLQNLTQNEKDPENETINDTWLDIAVYAVIAIMYRKGWFQELELKDK